MGHNKIPATPGWQVKPNLIMIAILQTNHQPLAYTNKTKYQNNRIMRWVLALQRYNYTVQGIPGKDNVAADYLSHVMN